MQDDALQPGTTTLATGEKVGHYRVIEQIGAGGMSIVYRAHDDLLHREVAVKQIRLAADDDGSLRRRVQREAQVQKQAGAALPDRLVQLIEVVDEPRGLFLVSEYVDGLSLEQELTRYPEPMDLKRALGIIAAGAQALEALHQRGIIHRDLKPANILLPRTGGLKLADFGLATAMSEQQLQSVGSVRYMAPELLRGDAADGRADLYALGMVGYEMLVGRRAFEQAFRMVLRDQRNQAMRWVKWHTNPRVRATPVTQMRPEVPAAIGELVDRMMEKEADARVPAATEVIEAIRRHYAGGSAATGEAVASAPGQTTAGAPVGTVAPTQPAGDTAPVPRRPRVALILGCVLGFWLLVGGGFGAYIYNEQASAERQRQSAARAVLDEADQLYRAGEYEDARQLYAHLVDDWPAGSPFGRAGEAGVLLSRGRYYLERGDYDAARRDLQQARALDVFDPDHLRGLIDEAEQRGEFDRAVAAIEESIAASEFGEARQQLREWRDVTLTREEEQRLAEISARLEDQRARHEREQVLEAVDRLVERDRRDAAIDRLRDALEADPSVELEQRYDALVSARRHDELVTRAEAAEAAGDLGEAIELYSRALQVEERPQVQRELRELRSQADLERGLRLLEEGRASEAEAALLRSLRYTDNPQAREALQRVEATERRQRFVSDGDEAFAGGDFEAAIAQYTNALEIEADDEVQQKLQRAQVHNLLEQTEQALDRDALDAAEAAVAELAAFDAVDPADLEAIAEAEADLERHRRYREQLEAGDAARAESRFGEAKRRYREAREVFDTEEVRERLDEAEFDDAIAKARHYLEVRRYDNARAWLAQAARYRDEEDEQIEELSRRIEEAAASE